jgi:hypothetical protein
LTNHSINTTNTAAKMRDTHYSQSRQIYANNLKKQPKSQSDINYYKDMSVDYQCSAERFKQRNNHKDNKIQKKPSSKTSIATTLIQVIEPRRINNFDESASKDRKFKDYNLVDREPQTMFKKLQDFYDSDQHQNQFKYNSDVTIENHGNSTSYNDFSSSKLNFIINVGFKLASSLKFKNLKLKNNSNIDVNLRKKVKTAGDKQTKENIFRTTFGSFNQINDFDNTKKVNLANQIGLMS